MDAKNIKFPSASSMAKKETPKKKKKKKHEEEVYMLGLMAQRRGPGGEHAAL